MVKLKNMNQNAVKPMKNQDFTTNHEAGGIIIWIMVMVTLFAALSYAVSQGTRTGGTQLNNEQAALATTAILDYANGIKRVVQELQINGCADTEISFENALVSGYSNANAPIDNSCHIFHPNGGGLQYVAMEEDFFDRSHSAAPEYGDWVIPDDVRVQDIHDNNQSEMLLTLPYIERRICLDINDKVNVTNPSDEAPAENGFVYTSMKFQGSYTNNSHVIGDNGGAVFLSGQPIACYLDDNGFYSFYQVLIPR